MMKKFLVSVIMTMTLLTYAFSQSQQMSAAMKTYHDAGIAMLDGINEGFDTHKLNESIDLFNDIDIYDWQPELVSVADTMQPRLYFDPCYADALIVNRCLVPLDDVSILRKGIGDKAGVAVFHVGIKAQGMVECSSSMYGECEMMVLAESGANVSLTVQDVSNDIVYEGKALDGGSVSWVSWSMAGNEDESSVVNFQIVNHSDKDVSLVVATNN